jgi:hypothetical protein
MPPQNPLDIHTIIELVSGTVAFAGFVIMLMIRNTQATVKEDLTRQIAEQSQGLAVHVAKDEEKDAGVSRTLNRMEGKIDQLAHPPRRIR